MIDYFALALTHGLLLLAVLRLLGRSELDLEEPTGAEPETEMATPPRRKDRRRA